MRKLIFNLHLYTALIAGAFILILGLTGSIMAFEPEIDHLLHWKLFHITPGARPLTLAELGANTQKAFPGEAIQAYQLSRDPDLAYRISTEKHLVYVNQYTGAVLGAQGDERPLLDYVHQLHLRLLWRGPGDPGGKIMAGAGAVMLFLALSGLYLWWPVKRMAIKKGSTGRRWWLELHNSVGIFSLVFLLALAATGTVIGFERKAVPLLYQLTGSQPSKPPKVPPPPANATPLPVDRILEIARTALPGAEPWMIEIPDPAGAYQVRLRFPEDLTPGGRSRALIDQYTGRLLFTEGSRTAPAGTRMVILNRAVHTGDIFGIPSKLVMSLASLLLALQVASGLLMWWKRIRKKPSPGVTQSAA